MSTRERILGAAREIYLEEGQGGVTMRAVAARVGVTPTALYRHFPRREALVDEVLDAGFGVFGGYLERALEGRTAGERLRLAGSGYLSFALEQPEIYRTIFMSARPADSEPRDARREATFRFLVERVRECMRAGEIAAGDPAATALTIWAHVHGLVSLRISGALAGSEEDFRAAYGASLGRLFGGLRTANAVGLHQPPGDGR